MDKFIFGTEGADDFTAPEGDNDTINAAGGDDIIRVHFSSGKDRIDGGTGFDYLYIGAGGPALVSLGSVPGPLFITNSYIVYAGELFAAPYATGVLFSIEGVQGGSGDDILVGSEFGNELKGMGGNDTLEGSLGADLLNGGAGIDTASYSEATGGLTVSLGAPHLNTGEAVGDTYTSIENILGSDHRDTLFGDSNGNTLDGGRDNDVLYGGAGADVLDGNRGADWAAYDTASSVIVADLLFSGENLGDAAGDSYIDIENLRGSQFGDQLGGDHFANQIEGLGGDDLIAGRDGDDAVFGGAGKDVILGEGGADQLDGGADNDTMDGGAGDDYLDGGEGFDVLHGGDDNDSVFGGNGGGTLFGDAGNDRIDGGVQDDTLYGGIGNDELRVGDGNNFAYGEAGIDLLLGASGIDRLYGGDDADTLYGVSGNDILDGGLGADLLLGGTGDDWYFVDTTDDRVLEFVGEGNDRVFASATFSLDPTLAEVEILTTTDNAGTAAIDLTGSNIANSIVGNAGPNTINGGGGADIMVGLGGGDIYYVDNAGDRAVEAAGDSFDRVLASVSFTLEPNSEIEFLTTADDAGVGAINLTGNNLANILYGNAGGNLLDGGGGIDFMAGFGGNDWYYVDNAGDRVVETAGGGSDRVFTSVSFTLEADCEVEVLKTTNDAGAGAISLTGNNFGNIVYGNAGGNTLDGGGGGDLMLGLGGNDIYMVDDASDRAVEAAGGGSDRVFASVTFALEAGSEIELLKTANDVGASAINLTGNGFANIIYGNAGGNTLDGGGDADLMLGLGGNDFYYVDDASDRAIEAAGNGSDRVMSTRSFTLEAGSEIELLKTTDDAGTTVMVLTGNELANMILGNAGTNVIDGGLGNDILWGLGGSDHFLFDTALNAATNVDAVRDFVVGSDFIRLENATFTTLAAGLLPTGAFRVGAAAADADDRIIYDNATGALIYDSNGNVGGGSIQFAVLSAGLALSGADFIVV